MKNLLKLVSLSLVCSILLMNFNFSLISSKASAKSTQDYSEKEVEELANELESVFEGSMIYDDDGEVIGVDSEIVKRNVSNTKYAYLLDDLEGQGIIEKDNNSNIVTPELLKTNPKWTEASNKCIKSKIKDTYGPTALTAIWEAGKDGNWKKGAKKLLKLGIKGSVPGLVASLTWFSVSCGDEASKKYDKYL